MQAAIDRIMHAYTMMTNLTSEEVQATREKLKEHLAGIVADEKALAVEGLRFLRESNRAPRRRMAREQHDG